MDKKEVNIVCYAATQKDCNGSWASGDRIRIEASRLLYICVRESHGAGKSACAIPFASDNKVRLTSQGPQLMAPIYPNFERALSRLQQLEKDWRHNRGGGTMKAGIDVYQRLEPYLALTHHGFLSSQY